MHLCFIIDTVMKIMQINSNISVAKFSIFPAHFFAICPFFLSYKTDIAVIRKKKQASFYVVSLSTSEQSIWIFFLYDLSSIARERISAQALDSSLSFVSTDERRGFVMRANGELSVPKRAMSSGIDTAAEGILASENFTALHAQFTACPSVSGKLFQIGRSIVVVYERYIPLSFIIHMHNGII